MALDRFLWTWMDWLTFVVNLDPGFGKLGISLNFCLMVGYLEKSWMDFIETFWMGSFL